MEQELFKRIEKDFIVAFKAKETEVKDCLGMVKAAILNKQKDNKNIPLDHNEIIMVLLSEVKKREQTLELIKNETSESAINLHEKTSREIDVLNTYLPQKMSLEEIKTELENLVNVLAGSGKLKIAKDLFIGAMKHFNQNFKGSFDNEVLKQVIEEKTKELFN